jgi:hypothetical protein
MKRTKYVAIALLLLVTSTVFSTSKKEDPNELVTEMIKEIKDIN